MFDRVATDKVLIAAGICISFVTHLVILRRLSRDVLAAWLHGM